MSDLHEEDTSTEDIDDATLAVRAADGDIAAFELLLRRYQNRVFGLALRMLADRAEAEDVTQEVFVTAWRQLGELTEPGAVRTWLFRIAHRQCLGVLRKRKSRKTEPTDTLPETASANPATDPERAAQTGAGVEALRQALTGLPAPQRVVWLLAEVDGLSYAEIAKVVGASEQSVRGRLSRARGKLAEVMRAWR